jgi:hypothetical protein
MSLVRKMVLLFLLALAGECSGYPFLTCTSRYVTNGWFEYDLTVHNDPFWSEIQSVGVSLVTVSNVVAFGDVPAGWTNSLGGRYVDWWSLHAPGGPPMSRPQTVTLAVQSPYSAWRRAHWGVQLHFTGTPGDFIYTRFGSGNIGGYANVDGVVPCPAEEADGSAPVFTKTVHIIQDISIDRLLVISNALRGVAFSWDSPSTVILQASHNAINWTNVTYILGDPGCTTWTSSVPLDSLGKCFRLRLHSSEHHPELVP